MFVKNVMYLENWSKNIVALTFHWHPPVFYQLRNCENKAKNYPNSRRNEIKFKQTRVINPYFHHLLHHLLSQPAFIRFTYKAVS